jgi:hypothetical protein
LHASAPGRARESAKYEDPAAFQAQCGVFFVAGFEPLCSHPRQARFLLYIGASRERVDDDLTLERKLPMKTQMVKYREKLEGRVLIPALMWMAGVPFGIVLLLWFFFFRGH